MVIDIKRAFLHGFVKRHIFIELPSEDPRSADKGLVGKLVKTMYGTRDAPKAFQEFCESLLGKLGFHACKGTPCVYFNPERDMKIVAHVDEFLCCGERNDLAWLRAALEKKIEIKAEVLGTRTGE